MLNDIFGNLKIKIKNNPYVFLFSFSLIIYMISATIFTVGFNGFYRDDNVYYGADILRIGFMENNFQNRLFLHPLYNVFIYPFTSLMDILGIKQINLMMAFLSAILQSINILLLFRIIDKILKNKKTKYFFVLLYIFAFSNFLFAGIAETFVLANTFYLLLFNFAYSFFEKKSLSQRDLLYLIGIGLLGFGITVSNIVPFELILMYMLYNLNVKNSKKIKYFLIINISIVLISCIFFVLVNPQEVYKLIINFKKNVLTDLNSYTVNTNISSRFIDYVREILIAPFVNIFPYSKGGYTFISNYTYIVGIFLIPMYVLIIKEFFRKNKNKFEISILIALLFNLLLHAVYGTNEAFIYSQHFISSIIIIFAFAISNFNCNKTLLYLKTIIVVEFLTILNNIVYFKNLYSTIFVFSIKEPLYLICILILFGLILILYINVFKKSLLEFIVMSIVTLLILTCFYVIALYKSSFPQIDSSTSLGSKLTKVYTYQFDGDDNLFIFDRYRYYISGIYETYTYQELQDIDLKFDDKKQILYITNNSTNYKEEISYDKKNDRYISKNSEGSTKYISSKTQKIYTLGMGLRNKYSFIYDSNKNKGVLMDIYTRKIIIDNIKNPTIDEEMYMIHGTLNDKSIIIGEDEIGIYKFYDGKKSYIDAKYQIKIPKFENNSYALKKLFHEIMINIDENGIKPNINTYDNAWYRDAAIAAMIVKDTGNISQIENWIKNIDEIYDKQNGVKEADNLGELLYLQSLIDKPNQELIDKIIKEAKTIAGDKDYISGKTDGAEHPIYQTAWLKFGLESLGLDDISEEFRIPYEIEDSYADLVWFYDIDKSKLKNDNINEENIDINYPYLSYARYNFYDLELPKNITKMQGYISYERCGSKANYENSLTPYIEVSSPHVWSAAELYHLISNE